jgi:hypothetical protein
MLAKLGSSFVGKLTSDHPVLYVRLHIAPEPYGVYFMLRMRLNMATRTAPKYVGLCGRLALIPVSPLAVSWLFGSKRVRGVNRYLKAEILDQHIMKFHQQSNFLDKHFSHYPSTI